MQSVSNQESAVPAVALSPEYGTLRHDLRTQLNQIMGYCDLVSQDATDLGSQALCDCMCEIDGGSKLILEVLNTFAALAGPPRREQREALHRELSAFSRRVLASVANAASHATAAGLESVQSDLDRISTAAAIVDTLAAELLESRAGHRTALLPEAQQGAMAALPRPASPALQPRHHDELKGAVLVVDDYEGNRDLLCRFLSREGLDVEVAAGGLEGIEKARARPFDLILLDLMMPEVDGFSILRQIKSDRELAHIAVVMLSAVDQLPSVLACLEAGAEDYLSKPFNPVLLSSRVRILLERKRLEEQEQKRRAELEAALAEVGHQKQISERLLFNILPEMVARQLHAKGSVDPMYFEDATIVMTDFVGFTASTEKLSADELVEVLNEYFTAFDRIIDRYGLEKLKTIGDSYMFVSGVPERSASHPVDAVLAAIDMVEAVRQMEGRPVDWKMRVGIHTGPVIAGVVGIRKFAFDIWGESVNLAARMESSGAPNRVNMSERTWIRVKDFFACEHRGKVATKEGREVDMYFANGLAPALLKDLSFTPPPAFVKRYNVYFQKPPRSFPTHLVPNGA